MSTSSTSTIDIKFVKRCNVGNRLSRRELLAKGLGLGSSFLVGRRFMASSFATWAIRSISAGAGDNGQILRPAVVVSAFCF